METLLALMDGVGRFSDLQRALPRISATMLSPRLRTLECAGVLHKKRARIGRGHEYALTEARRELEDVVLGLGRRGQRWARDMQLDDLDPRHLAWSIHLRMNAHAMPTGRTVLQLELTGAPTTAGASGSFTPTARSTCASSLRVSMWT